jgi:hypothetical protein
MKRSTRSILCAGLALAGIATSGIAAQAKMEPHRAAVVYCRMRSNGAALEESVMAAIRLSWNPGLNDRLGSYDSPQRADAFWIAVHIACPEYGPYHQNGLQL